MSQIWLPRTLTEQPQTPMANWSSDLVSANGVIYSGNVPIDVIRREVASHVTPAVALYNTSFGSSRTLSSHFIGNGSTTNSDGVILGSSLSASNFNTIALRLVTSNFNPNPYYMGVTNTPIGATENATQIGTDGTIFRFSALGNPGSAWTRYALPMSLLPNINTEYDLVLQTSNVVGVLPTSYLGLRAFLNGVDISSYVAPTTNGGANGIVGWGPRVNVICIGLDPTISSNYYGAQTQVLVAAILPNVLWDARQALRFHNNPWQLFKAPPRRIWAVSGSSISFSSATTDGADVLASNVSPLIGISQATTDGADILLANASVLIGASSATIDGADVLSATVATPDNVSAAWTDGADIFAFTGGPVVNLSGAIVDGADVLSSAVSPLISSSMTSTDGSDIWNIASSPLISFSAAILDGADLWNAQATSTIGTSVTYTDGSDSWYGQISSGTSSSDGGDWLIVGRHRAFA